MLRAVVEKRRAIEVSVSPATTTYETGEGEPSADGPAEEFDADALGLALGAEEALDELGVAGNEGSSVTVGFGDDTLGPTSQAASAPAAMSITAANATAARCFAPMHLRSPMAPV